MIIVFDLGKVILNFDLTIISSKLASLSGASQSEIAYFLFENHRSRNFDRGHITTEEFFDEARDKFKLPITLEQFLPVWNEIFTPIPGMEPLINSLKKNYKLGLLSNTNRPHFEYIAATYQVVQGMDWHLSYQLHLMKPEPEIYAKVAQFYNTSPSDIFFTDDLLPNIEGAKKAGFQAVQFHSVGQLRLELAARGITT
jgi:putative hydrolase of the HAD superfamily